jgi:hypothetical protein
MKVNPSAMEAVFMSTAASPSIRLEVQQVRMPKKPIDRMELARTIAELYLMGVIREEVDSEGVPRFSLTEKTL